jgi:hypothetical protein
VENVPDVMEHSNSIDSQTIQLPLLVKTTENRKNNQNYGRIATIFNFQTMSQKQQDIQSSRILVSFH